MISVADIGMMLMAHFIGLCISSVDDQSTLWSRMALGCNCLSGRVCVKAEMDTARADEKAAYADYKASHTC
eukprot:509026-Amphidinium_carterae.1